MSKHHFRIVPRSTHLAKPVAGAVCWTQVSTVKVKHGLRGSMKQRESRVPGDLQGAPEAHGARSSLALGQLRKLPEGDWGVTLCGVGGAAAKWSLQTGGGHVLPSPGCFLPHFSSLNFVCLFVLMLSLNFHPSPACGNCIWVPHSLSSFISYKSLSFLFCFPMYFLVTYVSCFLNSFGHCVCECSFSKTLCN